MSIYHSVSYCFSHEYLGICVLSYGHVGFVVLCLPLCRMSMFFTEHLIVLHVTTCHMKVFTCVARNVLLYELFLDCSNLYGKLW